MPFPMIMLPTIMAFDSKQLKEWLVLPTEGTSIEFKEANQQYSFDKLCEYCVGIANEAGGHIVLGVTDKPPRQAVGTAAFPNLVATEQKLFDRLRFRVDASEITHDGKRVVVLTIPGRPRGAAYSFDGRYLMRSGERLVTMSDDRLRAIFNEGQPSWLEEPAFPPVTGEEVLTLLDVDVCFQLLDRLTPSSIEAKIDQLLKLQLIDRVGSAFSVRRMGAILLARKLSDFPSDISRRAPRVVVYQQGSKLSTRIDQQGAYGYAVGFQRLVRFIEEQLPRNEVIAGALRQNVQLISTVMIRELTANAMIHQDFSMSGTSLMVEVYPDRVEFSNPGQPVLPVDRLIDNYQSRNERLADLMRRMRICEEKGSGIDKVIHDAEVLQLPAPDFRVGVGRTSVVVFGPRSLANLDREGRVRACYQHCCLKYVMNEPMTNQSMRGRFNLPDDRASTASQMIAATMEAGKIRLADPHQTSTRYRRYIPFWA